MTRLRAPTPEENDPSMRRRLDLSRIPTVMAADFADATAGKGDS